MPATPSTSTLLSYKHKAFDFGINTPNALSSTSGSGSHQSSMAASLEGGDGLSLKTSDSGTGSWIPYAPQQCIFGFADGSATWIGSGPFSGCEIALFTDGSRVGMAHVSRESGSSAGEVWNSVLKSQGFKLLSQWKVPLPSNQFYACSHVFVVLATLQITRVDVRTPNMGGGSGTIYDVENLLTPVA